MTNREAKSISTIYKEFFSKQNCKQLMMLFNQFSVADAVMVSGSSTSTGNRITNILVEYKEKRFSVCDYSSSMVETEKIERLQQSMKLFDAPAFLVFEYPEVVLVFRLHSNKIYEESLVDCPETTDFENSDRVLKVNTFFDYAEADYIISKRTWNNGTAHQLFEYINTKK